MQWTCCAGAILLAAFALPARAVTPAPGRILRVGPGRTFTLPSQAAAAAQDGDEVDIDAGTYRKDVAVWRANHLTLRGVGGAGDPGRPGTGGPGQSDLGHRRQRYDCSEHHLHRCRRPRPQRRGHPAGGRGADREGCVFHDNEDGILAGASPTSDITIENSEFDHNGQGDGNSHNIYIGHVRTFTLRGCYSHNANARP